MAIFSKLDFDTKILMRSPFLDESSSNLECRLVMRLSKIDVQKISKFSITGQVLAPKLHFQVNFEKNAAARTEIEILSAH